MTETLDPIKDNNRRGYVTGIFLAILAAALYALNAPLSKLLLEYLPPLTKKKTGKKSRTTRKKNRDPIEYTGAN